MHEVCRHEILHELLGSLSGCEIQDLLQLLRGEVVWNSDSGTESAKARLCSSSCCLDLAISFAVIRVPLRGHRSF